jgi:hypothetical protein
VAIGFGDRAHRDLSHLRAAAHDDDALAVDLGERWRFADLFDTVERAQHPGHRQQSIAGQLHFQIDAARRRARLDVDVGDVGVVVGEDLRDSGQHARAVDDCAEDGVYAHGFR